ncbi:MAG: hypothetical protein ABIN58_03270 [candidate division WOR-3 bacterium]
MDVVFIRECWETILRQEQSLCGAPYFPLAGMKDCLADFDLPCLPCTEALPAAPAAVSLPAPAFRALTEEGLLQLRSDCYARTNLTIVTAWAEALMRFCEVRLASLRKRARAQWKGKAAVRLNLLHLAVFLMDYCLLAKDMRFLNTVLKLSDQKWLFKPKKLRAALKKGDPAALFELRVLLMTDYVLRRLEEGWKLE